MQDEVFSANALKQMAEMSVGKPVTVDFDKNKTIGKVISTKVEGNTLKCELQIFDETIINQITMGYRKSVAFTFNPDHYLCED